MTYKDFHIQFYQNPLYFRIIADFEANNEKDGSKIGNKTTNTYKQNPVLNGYYIISKLEDVLESGYYESLSDYKLYGRNPPLLRPRLLVSNSSLYTTNVDLL